MPTATVVVPTYRRPAGVAALLRALEAQVTPWSFEVVVVDDGSPDEMWADVCRVTREAAIDARAVRHPVNRGAAAARNTGVRLATSPVVAFTDDDCIPAPGWLAALLEPLVAGRADVAQGRTEPDPLQPRGPFSHTLEIRAEYGWYETCNIAYRRVLLDQLDGFDEDLARGHGEDTDLGWRALAAGAVTTFVPDALVHHDVGPSSWRRRARDAQRRTQMAVVVRRHPALRSKLRGRVFLDESHPSALLALGGLAVAAAAPRSKLAVAAAVGAQVPYIRFRTRYKPVAARRRDWPWVLPLMLAADLVDVAVLARASVRHRTLLL